MHLDFQGTGLIRAPAESPCRGPPFWEVSLWGGEGKRSGKEKGVDEPAGVRFSQTLELNEQFEELYERMWLLRPRFVKASNLATVSRAVLDKKD